MPRGAPYGTFGTPVSSSRLLRQGRRWDRHQLWQLKEELPLQEGLAISNISVRGKSGETTTAPCQTSAVWPQLAVGETWCHRHQKSITRWGCPGEVVSLAARLCPPTVPPLLGKGYHNHIGAHSPQWVGDLKCQILVCCGGGGRWACGAGQCFQLFGLQIFYIAFQNIVKAWNFQYWIQSFIN